jgi:hypothetical protein
MRKALIAALVLILLAWLIYTLAQSSGCVRITRVPPATQPGFDLRSDVYDYTRMFLYAKPSRAKDVAEVARQMKEVATGEFTGEQLRSLALRLTARQAGLTKEQADLADLAADILLSRLRRRLGFDVSVTLVPAGEMTDTRAAIVAAADGMLEAAVPYLR